MRESNNADLITLLKQLWNKISLVRRRQFKGLVALTVFCTLLDVVSLGALLPFLSALVMPEKVFQHPFVLSYSQSFGINSPQELLLPLTIAFVASALVASTMRLFTLWLANRVAFAIGAELSLEVYRRTLHQPYSVHLSRNSSEVVSGIFNKVNEVVFWTVLPLITLMSSTLLILATTLTLLFINFYVAGAALLVFSIGYGVTILATRRKLNENGRKISVEQNRVVKVLQEGLGGIRDVLLDGTQQAYCHIYASADRPLRRAYASNTFLAGSPRFIMEAIGMVLIALMAYYLSVSSSGIVSVLPVLGTLALAAQRMLPALQQGYSAWANMTGTSASLADTIELLSQPMPPDEIVEPKLSYEDVINLKNVFFRYNDDGPWVLKGFDLKISKGDRVGIIGRTGSGKSTVVDILMGLLEPTTGQFIVDGKELNGPALRTWQRKIAHVPQSIYISDATISENIAFGIPADEINQERMIEAAIKAQMHDVIKMLPGGYDTLVGERGIRLSGGQRQRLGIARALYKQASILFFDEATSALDGVTENSVMQAIENMDQDLTVVIVAHRLSTLEKCNKIIELDQGSIKRQLNYEELLQFKKAQ